MSARRVLAVFWLCSGCALADAPRLPNGVVHRKRHPSIQFNGKSKGALGIIHPPHIGAQIPLNQFMNREILDRPYPYRFESRSSLPAIFFRTEGGPSTSQFSPKDRSKS